MINIDKREITEARLEEALERLVQGSPERTKADGKINLKRINDEAGLSASGIYYYKDFVRRARKTILSIKTEKAISRQTDNLNEGAKLKRERDKEKQLKVRYRKQRIAMKLFADGVVEENAKLHFSYFEALEKIKSLEQQLALYKISPITGKKV